MRKYLFFFLLPTPKIRARSPRGQTGMKPRDLVFGLFAPSTFEHTYPVRSDVYSHLPFTLTIKKKKKNKNKKKKTERKSRQTNLSKNKKKGRTIGYTRHDTNFCSGTSARSQCVDGLWSKETSRSETVVFIRLVSYQLSKPVSLLYLSTNILYTPLGT